MPRAALFDMDRTLVRLDTATLYIRYQREKGHASHKDVLQVAWWMLKYTLGVIDAERVAETVLKAYKGKREAWLIDYCEQWFVDSVRKHVADAGRAAVQKHREAGDVVAIVTGATPYAARPLARELGIDHVVCTELEVADGHFTGQVKKPMSYGAGKVTLATALGNALGFSLDDATFYSDSITDLPLLERVAEPIVVNPDTRLRRVAVKRRWPIERW